MQAADLAISELKLFKAARIRTSDSDDTDELLTRALTKKALLLAAAQ